MKTILKITFLTLAFCGGTFCLYSQTLYETFEQQRPFIGSSNPAALNINHPNGTHYQDIKRSIGLIHIKNDGDGVDPGTFRNFVLINNTKNNKRPLILMSLLQNYYDFEENVFDEESNIEFEAYATLDYEFAHGSNSGDDEQDAFIGKIYPIKLKLKAVFDIVGLEYELLEIIESDGKDKLLQNAYATGFNINPNPNTNRYILAGHSGRDHKKLSNPFTARSYSQATNNDDDEDEELDEDELEYFRTLFFQSDDPHPNFLANTQEGNLDSNGIPPSFNSNGQFVGFWNVFDWNQTQSLEGEIKSLIGAWYKNQDKILGLLDPNNTHLTNVPGGYLNDQILVNMSDLDLVLGENNENFYSTPGINPSDVTMLEEDVLMIKPGFIFNFFSQEEDEDEDSGFNNVVVNEWLNLAPGIKRDIVNDSPVVLSVFHLDRDAENGRYTKRLIYGGYLSNEIVEEGDHGFSAIGWNCDDDGDQQMYGACNRIQPDGVNGTGMSDEFRSSYFSAALNNVNVLADGNAIVYPLDHAIPIQVELKNIGKEPVNVHAVRYPGEIATNALQLFKPKELEKKFDYFKYDENRGRNSTDYHIESISIAQTQGENTRTIETGDNGGYLNLVNPVYKLGPIKTSVKEETEADSDIEEKKYKDILPNFVTITMKIHNNRPSSAVQYRAWIDYFNTEELGGVDTNASSYGFVNDGPNFHWIEDVKNPYSEDHPNYHDANNFAESDNNSSTNISFTFKMPDADEIDLNEEETRTTRLRIGIYADPTEEPEAHGTFAQGEVEDYLIEIQAPTEQEIAEAIAATAKIDLRAAKRQRTGEPNESGNEPFIGSAGSNFAQLPSFSGGSSASTEQEQALFHGQYPINQTITNSNEGYVTTYSFHNYGTKGKEIISRFFQRVQAIFNQSYAFLPNALNTPTSDIAIKSNDLKPQNFGNNNNPFNPNNNNVNDDNPANDANPIGLGLGDIFHLPKPDGNDPFDGIDAQDILNNSENRNLFYQTYNNVVRIASSFVDPTNGELYEKFKSNDLPQLSDNGYWWMYNFFIAELQKYQNNQLEMERARFIAALFADILNDPTKLLDVQFLLSKIVIAFYHYAHKIPMEFFPYIPFSQELQLLYLIYDYMMPYYVAMRNMFWLISKGAEGLNVVSNGAKIALDISGDWIPEPYSERSIKTELAIGQYPKDDNLAVIYHAKGSDNQLVLAIDNDGYLVHRVKLGSANWQEISSKNDDKKIPLDEIKSVAVRFDHGQVSLFLDDDKIASGTVTDANGAVLTEFNGHSHFTDINNGARWGGTVIHFSGLPDLNDDLNLVDIDAIFYRFLGFGEALADKTITLRSIPKNTTPKSIKAIKSAPLNGDNAVNKEVDFSIFPNPAKNELNIIVEVQQAGQLSVNIFDLAGKQVYEMQESEISKGHQLITLRNLKLSAGQYIVKVKAGNVTQSEQVVFE